MSRAAIAMLAALALAPMASASTIALSEPRTDLYDGTTRSLDASASPGERNTMTVTLERGDPWRTAVVHDDTAPTEPGLGCTALDAHTVRCEPARLSSAAVELGDGDDKLTFSVPEDYSSTTPTWQQIGSIEVTGDEGDDELTCDSCQADGGPGNDLLSGRGDWETFYGGPGDDVLLGGAGRDSLSGGPRLPETGPSGRDHLDGGPGPDALDDGDRDRDTGPDTLIGGEGWDGLYSYLDRTRGVAVNLADPGSDGAPGEDDSLDGIEQVTGSLGDDFLIGDDGPNRLDGSAGHDFVAGKGGNDTLISEVGPADAVTIDWPDPAGYGPDALIGGHGDDVFKTDTALASAFRCDEGEDRIVLRSNVPGPRGTKPQPTPGPLIGSGCERLEMKRFAVNPLPVEVGREGRMTFEFSAFRCCDHLFQLSRPTSPWRSYDRRIIARRRMTMKAPEEVALKWRERAVAFRMKIEGAGRALFVWRFEVGPAGRQN